MNDTRQHADGWLQAILAEYSSLRAEILQRSTAQIQICTVAGTATVAIIGFSVTVKGGVFALWLLPIVAVFLAIGVRFTDRDTVAAAAHIVEIETEINRALGEDTMIWESRHGLLPRGYLSRWLQVLGLKSN